MSDATQPRGEAHERARAIRALLAMPMLDAARHPEAFGDVVRQRAELVRWFDDALGWPLRVEVRGGWARLHKRCDHPDASRPARSARGKRFAFDRRRYELLCLICAELCTHRVTTIGLLARNVASACAASDHLRAFGSDRHRERRAFVDALKLLAQWGVVTVDGGDAEDFVSSDRANAFVEVDSARLHVLLASATTPSMVRAMEGVQAGTVPVRALTDEPRYGRATAEHEQRDQANDVEPDDQEEPVRAVGDEQRTRWLRHSLARRLLDDPVVYLEDLSPAQREYLANPAGRRWLLDRAADAGLDVEQRAEGLLAIDPGGEATDELFPAPNDNVRQAALLLTDELVDEPGEQRELSELSAVQLARWARQLLGQHPGWARQYRNDDGPDQLAANAARLLERFGLATRDEHGAVCGRWAIARFRPDRSAIEAPPPSLLDTVDDTQVAGDCRRGG